MPTSTERVRRFRERKAVARARREYNALLRRTLEAEAERDKLRVLARDRLDLLLEQARVWRAELREAESREAAAAMVESGVPVVENAEAPS